MAPCKLPRYVRSVVCAGLAVSIPSHDRIDDDNPLAQLRPHPCPAHRDALGIASSALAEANARVCQRAASSSSSGSTAESPLRLNIAAAAATAVAAGSVAWYYHLYGPTADAATPAEEG